MSGSGSAEGALAAIGALAEVIDTGALSDAYREAMRTAYWDDHDVHVVIAVAYAGISRLLAAAADPGTDEEAEYALRSAAKGLTYDLASFTWTGWDEPGIDIDPSMAAAGLAAARANLSMAHGLGKGDLPLSRAHWMLGAHQLTSRDLAGAAISFEEAADRARAAGEDADAALAEAFEALTTVVADPSALGAYEAALNRLQLLDGGEGFVGQVETARAVLDA